MKAKRFLLRTLVVLFSFLAIGVGTKIIYDNIASDEISFQEGYEIKKEKCELLRTIANDLIEEGKGINIQKITNKDVRYRIYNNDDNIIIYYYIGPYTRENRYNAQITLNKDYKIIDEEYSIEIEDYETYKHTMQFIETVLSAIQVFIIGLIVFIIYLVIALWVKCKENKNETVI